MSYDMITAPVMFTAEPSSYTSLCSTSETHQTQIRSKIRNHSSMMCLTHGPGSTTVIRLSVSISSAGSAYPGRLILFGNTDHVLHLSHCLSHVLLCMLYYDNRGKYFSSRFILVSLLVNLEGGAGRTTPMTGRESSTGPLYTHSHLGVIWSSQSNY